MSLPGAAGHVAPGARCWRSRPARARTRTPRRLRSVRLFGSYAGARHATTATSTCWLVDDLTWAEKLAAIGIAGDVWLERGPYLSAKVLPTAEFQRLLGLELAFAENVEREGIAL